MKRLCLALAALLFGASVAAQTIEAEGVAAIAADGRDQARQRAVQDALHQASLSASALVQGSSSVNGAGELKENLQVTTNARVANHTVLQEWESNGLLHVLVRAEVQDEAPPCGTTSAAPAAAAVQRKKVTVTRFYVANPIQVEDLADIRNGYPQELLRRLGVRGGVLPVNATSSLLPGGGEADPDSPGNRDLIRRIAEQTGSQLVISGVIRDAGSGAETLRPYVGWQGSEKGRRSEIGLPWPGVAVGVKPEASQRRLDVEVFVHDGLTGALVARQRQAAVTNGRVVVGRDIPFASAAFFATPFGSVVDQTLNSETAAIGRDLDCLPFAANIVRIDGKKIYIDAGATSKLAVGDKLTVYRKNSFMPVAGLSASALGIPETLATTLTLTQVQPLFSVGEPAVEPGKAGIQVGDLVRFDSGAAK